MILNITNGDAAVNVMKEADLPGDFLPWDDVLHEGPVPNSLDLAALSKVRAQFIINTGWDPSEDVWKSFRDRDQQIAEFRDYQSVLLWFEHDLYDQLQLIQILDWLGDRKWGDTQVELICTDRYLGRLTPEEMTAIGEIKKPVTKVQLDLAKKAWSAFRAHTPDPWVGLLHQDTRALPFLEGAIIRMLEEYPNVANGLSRTESQALTFASLDSISPQMLFRKSQKKEERIFMGDTVFWDRLRGLLEGPSPLLRVQGGQVFDPFANPEQKVTVTELGMEVLEGKRNRLEFVQYDRWFGGVHITHENQWTWDSESKVLVKQ